MPAGHLWHPCAPVSFSSFSAVAVAGSGVVKKTDVQTAHRFFSCLEAVEIIV
jgi:hypothetical protein